VRRAAAILCAALVACSRSNNLLLGRVEGHVGGHPAIVTDCYRITVPAPDTAFRATDGRETQRWAPCRDAEIIVAGPELRVNGQPYASPLAPGDTIVVDHGAVSTRRGNLSS